MLNDDNQITIYMIDKSIDDNKGENKRLNYMKKKNTQEKVLEITVTMSVVLLFVLAFDLL